MCLRVDYTPAAACHGLIVPCVKVLASWGNYGLLTPYQRRKVSADGWLVRSRRLQCDLNEGRNLTGQGVHAYDNSVSLLRDTYPYHCSTEGTFQALAIGVLAWQRNNVYCINRCGKANIYELCSLAMLVRLPDGSNKAEFETIKKIANYHERSRRRALERVLPGRIAALLQEYDQIEW